jgi:peptidoglycan/LPS O-acetylase OafA/YrhL
MAEIPPDLSFLGDRLAAAAAVRLREQRRRRQRLAKVAATGIAAALTIAVLSPGALSPADRGLFQLASASTATYVPAACDQPRGATMAAARPCAPPGTTDAPLGSLARRLADR